MCEGGRKSSIKASHSNLRVNSHLIGWKHSLCKLLHIHKARGVIGFILWDRFKWLVWSNESVLQIKSPQSSSLLLLSLLLITQKSLADRRILLPPRRVRPMIFEAGDGRVVSLSGAESLWLSTLLQLVRSVCAVTVQVQGAQLLLKVQKLVVVIFFQHFLPGFDWKKTERSWKVWV